MLFLGFYSPVFCEYFVAIASGLIGASITFPDEPGEFFYL